MQFLNSPIKIACAQFIRLFLVNESATVNKTLNRHINAILQQYFNRKFPLLNFRTVPKELHKILNEVLFTDDSNLNIHVNSCFHKSLSPYPESAIKDILHNIIRQYVIFSLSDECTKAKESRSIANEILNSLAEWKKESELFDQLELECETCEDFLKIIGENAVLPVFQQKVRGRVMGQGRPLLTA